jgi:putative hydrolase
VAVKSPAEDVNAVISAMLRDLASIQTDRHKVHGYKRAASAVFWLDVPIDQLRMPNGSFPKIAGLGPSSMRIVTEVLETGESATVERAVAASGKTTEVAGRRALRTGVLSRAAVLRVLKAEPPRWTYRGDFQMHSTWSDGKESVLAMARGCRARGYDYCAITDHAVGLPAARGMAPARVTRQQRAIDQANRKMDGFRVLKGIEANIAADGTLDLDRKECQRFEIVLAAPHVELRSMDDQTARMQRAIRQPGIHILAHPRGRKIGARAGIMADWDAVFGEAASRSIAIEIDGDPTRQDLDYMMAARALRAGCLFALDSDAHSARELVYAETAQAHAVIAGIPAARVVNTWPLDRLLAWARR